MSALPALKLYQEDPNGAESSPLDLKLRQAFEEFLLRDTPKKSTRQAYYTAIEHWEQLLGNPSLRELHKKTAQDFRDRFLEAGGQPENIRKNWRHLKAILRRVGPADSGNPRGEGILSFIPWAKFPSNPETKIPRIATDDELNALYEECGCATWPPENKSKAPAPVIWRSAMVGWLNYGPRTFDLWNLPHKGLLWDFDSAQIRFVAAKTSKLQGMPLNETAFRHFKALRRISKGVFYPTTGRKQFYAQWAEINQRAGLKVPMELRDLRETCCTRYGEEIGKWILGHGANDVTGLHYFNPTPEVVAAIHAFSQPSAFLKGPFIQRQRSFSFA